MTPVTLPCCSPTVWTQLHLASVLCPEEVLVSRVPGGLERELWAGCVPGHGLLVSEPSGLRAQGQGQAGPSAFPSNACIGHPGQLTPSSAGPGPCGPRSCTPAGSGSVLSAYSQRLYFLPMFPNSQCSVLIARRLGHSFCRDIGAPTSLVRI